MTRSTKYFALALTFAIGAFLWPKQKDQLYFPRSGWFVTPAGDTMGYLTGPINNFRVNYHLTEQPDDFSPNQRKELGRWILTTIAVPVKDSTHRNP